MTWCPKARIFIRGGHMDGKTNKKNENLDQFLQMLPLNDQKIIEKFKLTIDGRPLTKRESIKFLRFLRKELKEVTNQ